MKLSNIKITSWVFQKNSQNPTFFANNSNRLLSKKVTDTVYV